MNCAYCKYNDGMVYTSIPPKYKCTITNEFHLGLDDCNVEFAPVKHGRWINVNDDSSAFRCSVCGEISCCNSAYCNVCGAKMDEVEE